MEWTRKEAKQIKIKYGAVNQAMTHCNRLKIHWINLKGTLHFFLEIGSFYNSPRVKQLSFTIFRSIQPISGSGGSTFSFAKTPDPEIGWMDSKTVKLNCLTNARGVVKWVYLKKKKKV